MNIPLCDNLHTHIHKKIGIAIYRRNWLLSACAYNMRQQENVRLTKSMRLTGSMRLIN